MANDTIDWELDNPGDALEWEERQPLGGVHPNGLFVEVNGIAIGRERTVNFVEGSGIEIEGVDDTGNDKISITFNPTILNNITATRAPLVTDDAVDGYKPGSLWVWRTELRAWLCLDASAENAVWSEYQTGASTYALDDLLDVIITTPALNQVLKYNGTHWVNSSSSAAGVTSFAGRDGVVAPLGTDYAGVLKLDDCLTPDDNTDLNATNTKHGLLPKLSGTGSTYLTGTGTWGTPAGLSAINYTELATLGIAEDQEAVVTGEFIEGSFVSRESGATVDAGTIIAHAVGGNWRWHRVYAGDIDPGWFGALFQGNGGADDTAAFQAARAVAEANNVGLFIPRDGLNLPTTDVRTLDVNNVPVRGPGQMLGMYDAARAKFGNIVQAQTEFVDTSGIALNLGNIFNNVSTAPISIHHTISGATTLGEPQSGFMYNWYTAPISIFYHHQSGYNTPEFQVPQGRTSAHSIYGTLLHEGDGDSSLAYLRLVMDSPYTALSNTGGAPSGLFIASQSTIKETNNITQMWEHHYKIDAGLTNVRAHGIYIKYKIDSSRDYTADNSRTYAAFRATAAGDDGDEDTDTEFCDAAYQAIGKWDTGVDTVGLLSDYALAAKKGQYIALNATQRWLRMANQWAQGVVTVIGDPIWNNKKIYLAASNGTTGATPPTHGAGTVSDGGVDWTWLRNESFYGHADKDTFARDRIGMSDDTNGFEVWNNSNRVLVVKDDSDIALVEIRGKDRGEGAVVGRYKISGINAADALTHAFNISVAFSDDADGSEDTWAVFQTQVAGVLTTQIKIEDGMQVGTPSAGATKGVGTINAAGHSYYNNIPASSVRPYKSVAAAAAMTLALGEHNQISLDSTGHTINIPVPGLNGTAITTHLRLIQGSGGSKTVTTWQNTGGAGTFKWSGGAAPTLQTTVGYADTIEFISRTDGGGNLLTVATWLGFTT